MSKLFYVCEILISIFFTYKRFSVLYTQMNFEQASHIVKTIYTTQADKLISSLCPEAICTLAILHGKNIRRQFSDHTIDKLSQMEPHRQCGFLTNPLMEFMIGQCTNNIMYAKPIESGACIIQGQLSKNERNPTVM